MLATIYHFTTLAPDSVQTGYNMNSVWQKGLNHCVEIARCNCDATAKTEKKMGEGLKSFCEMMSGQPSEKLPTFCLAEWLRTLEADSWYLLMSWTVRNRAQASICSSQAEGDGGRRRPC